MIMNNGTQEYTCAVSDDSNRPLHCFSTYKPFLLHPLLHPQSFNGANQQQVELKTVCLSPFASEEVSLGTKENATLTLKVAVVFNKGYANVANRYFYYYRQWSFIYSKIWSKDRWAACPLHLHSTENKADICSAHSVMLGHLTVITTHIITRLVYRNWRVNQIKGKCPLVAAVMLIGTKKEVRCH